MEKYELYYQNDLIGIVEINSSIKTYKCISKNEDIFDFLKVDMNYLHPFLESRIYNMKKFSLTQVQYQTDCYRLVKV